MNERGKQVELWCVWRQVMRLCLFCQDYIILHLWRSNTNSRQLTSLIHYLEKVRSADADGNNQKKKLNSHNTFFVHFDWNRNFSGNFQWNPSFRILPTAGVFVPRISNRNLRIKGIFHPQHEQFFFILAFFANGTQLENASFIHLKMERSNRPWFMQTKTHFFSKLKFISTFFDIIPIFHYSYVFIFI